MLNSIKNLVTNYPAESLTLGVLGIIIGTIAKGLGLDLYKLIKKILYHTGLFIWGLFRAGLKEKKTITSARTSSQNKWKRKPK